MGFESPKEEVKKPMGQRAHDHNKKKKGGQWAQGNKNEEKILKYWFDKNLCQASMQAHEGMRRNMTNLEAHAPFS